MRFAQAGRFVVPLDAPGPLQYFKDALRIPYSVSGRVLAAVPTRKLGVRGERVLAAAPPEIEEFGENTILLQEYEGSARGRTIAFLFNSPTETLPHAIVKLRPEGSTGADLAAEADAHRRLHAALTPELRATVPEVLRYETRTPRPSPLAPRPSNTAPRPSAEEFLMLSTVAGHSQYVELQSLLLPSRRIDAHFDGAGTWLARFHNATAGERWPVPDGDGAAELRRFDISACASHGDFWARNLLTDASGRVGVVDWELFRYADAPFFDLFQYALTYGISYPWTRYQRLSPPRAFAKTFLARNRVSRAVRRFAMTYMESRRLPRETLAPAFRLFLATRGTMRAEPPEKRGTYRLPWAEFAAMLDRSGASVFSG